MEHTPTEAPSTKIAECDPRISLIPRNRRHPRIAIRHPVGFWLPLASLWWREIVRFYRQRSRVVGYLGSPLVFWLVIGSGFGSSFRPGGATGGSNYLEYFFPGTLVLIVLFTSIFGMMTVIEDRQEGFLRSVLVSPIPRSSLVLGKILGSATLATLQGLLFLLLAPLIGIHLGFAPLIWTVGILFLIAIGLTNLGFFIAWRLDSTHGFHALVNLFLVPLWLLSGALFPISGAATWIGWIMRLNPLTYSLAALRRSLYLHSSTQLSHVPDMPLALAITVVFAVATFLAALRIVHRHGARSMV